MNEEQIQYMSVDFLNFCLYVQFVPDCTYAKVQQIDKMSHRDTGITCAQNTFGPKIGFLGQMSDCQWGSLNNFQVAHSMFSTWIENSTYVLLFSFIDRKAETIEPNPIGVVHRKHSKGLTGDIQCGSIVSALNSIAVNFHTIKFLFIVWNFDFNSCTKKSTKTSEGRVFVVKWTTQIWNPPASYCWHTVWINTHPGSNGEFLEM